MIGLCAFLRTENMPFCVGIYDTSSIHSVVDGLLGCFCLGCCTWGCRYLFKIIISFPSNIYLELLDHMAVLLSDGHSFLSGNNCLYHENVNHAAKLACDILKFSISENEEKQERAEPRVNPFQPQACYYLCPSLGLKFLEGRSSSCLLQYRG